jgi:hypothetical protein
MKLGSWQPLQGPSDIGRPNAPPGAVFQLDDVTPVVLRNQHDICRRSPKETLLLGRIPALIMAPYRQCVPTLVHQQHARLRRFLQACVRTVPNVLLTNHQVARTRMAGSERWRLCFFMTLGSRQDVPPMLSVHQ